MFYHRIVAPVAYESERAFGYNVSIVEEHSGQSKTIRVFIPKSQIEDGRMTDWITHKTIVQHVMEWTNGRPARNGCFRIDGLTSDPIFLKT